MLVYDITSEKSFDNISKWLRNIEEVLVMITLLHLWCLNGLINVACISWS